MIFVIGGTKQGKLKSTLANTGLSYTDVAFGEQDSLEIAKKKKIFYNLQSYIKRQMSTGVSDFSDMLDEILNVNPDVIIICDEVGCGIVPIDKFEREYREVVGRFGCKIAQKADKVFRVFCGISTRIK